MRIVDEILAAPRIKLVDQEDDADGFGSPVIVGEDSQRDEIAPRTRNRADERELELPELPVREDGAERVRRFEQLAAERPHGAENRRSACLFKGTMEDLGGMERLVG